MKKYTIAILIGASGLIFSCKKTDTNASIQANISPASATNRDAGGASGGVTFDCKACLMTYPDSSNLPRSAAAFNESDVLVATEPGQITCGIDPQFIKAWYSDEHALTLGVRQINIITKSGAKNVTATTNYPITATPKSASVAIDPLIGATDQNGDYSGNDVSVGGGRPLSPSLYITDISDNLKSRAGDWQQGGTGIAPNKLYGTWKAAVRTVDKTKNPQVVTITPDADPAKNNWNLAGGDTPPVKVATEGYTTEVAWDVNKLIAAGIFIRGHIYRLQFMVHDGDQNKVGGDVGQTCTTIFIPD